MKHPKDVTILIVDDEQHLRESIVFDFKRRGFNVLTAENGRQAFEIATQTPVDLIISDIRMPGGDGVELLQRLRTIDPELPPMIFLTGFADVADGDVYAMGAKKVLSKPFNRNELIDAAFELTGTQLPSKGGPA